MLIKEFEDDVGYALIIDGLAAINNATTDDMSQAALIIYLYKDYFSVVKNRYGKLYDTLPLCLLDDYLEHFSRKFEHRSPILDNFKLEPKIILPAQSTQIHASVIKKYNHIVSIADMFKDVMQKEKERDKEKTLSEEYFRGLTKEEFYNLKK